MPKSPHLMVSPEDVEAAFYEGLQNGEVEQVMACWAEDEELVCIPPGGEPVHGPADIRALFTALLANGSITVRPMHVHKSHGLAQAIHTVTEHVSVMTDEGQAVAQLYALNVFHKTPHGWRLVAHHTSPGHLADVGGVGDSGEPSSVLH